MMTGSGRIGPFQLARWARRTVVADRRSYKRSRAKGRPLSLRRVLRALVPDLREPIFVVGAPRSGTTFLGVCLAELPGISYHFEPVATKAAARYVYEGRWKASRAGRFYRTVYAWLMRIHLDGDLRFAEKTPQNSLVIPFLYEAFPDARFIHIIRDGRDVALSYSRKPWLQASQAASGRYEPGGYRYGPYARFWVERERVREFETTSDIRRCAWAWRRFTEGALDAASNLPAGQYHEVRYEALVADPAGEAARLLGFLGEREDEPRGLFREAVVEGANPGSVGRWERELSGDQVQEIEEEAGGLLRRLGYAV